MERFLLFLLCWLVSGAHAAGNNEQTLQLARFPKSANQFVAAQLVQEIYKRSGLSAKVQPMPPRRATIEAKEGKIDGEVSRIENYFLENPELIRVTPAYSSIVMTAFSRKSIAIQSKDDLAKYKIGIVRGVQTSIDLTAGLQGVEQASDSESLFSMLGADRFDVAIDVNVNGRFDIQKLGVKGASEAGTLLRTEVFTALAPNNAHLASKLSKSITEMKRTGELDRLKRDFELDFIKRGVEPD